eukprot:GHVN01060801.1.p2 GENE.GHVN01060801.1~~GHVN01060801.1.p2  ORF type:complete len:123 (+),score=40.34 GHVN01060801.1:922-1290(+)
MIKRELEKDETLKNENWERFLPNFKRKCIQRKKIIKEKKKEKKLFPPEPTPRKEDLMIASGEYFLSTAQKESVKSEKRAEKQKERTAERKVEREKQFEEPSAGEAAERQKKKARWSKIKGEV